MTKLTDMERGLLICAAHRPQRLPRGCAPARSLASQGLVAIAIEDSPDPWVVAITPAGRTALQNTTGDGADE